MRSVLHHIWHHPLNRGGRGTAVARFMRWQVANRLLPVPHIMPFIDDTVLVMERGMTGATGNWYGGLHELADMAFALHFLRPSDLFCDIGANVGSYTVLAAGAVGARCKSFEPIAGTFAKLRRNVAVNGLGHLADCYNMGIGAVGETLRFTASNDTTNRVASQADIARGTVVEVPVRRLDDVLQGAVPSLIKIDVEGWEPQVFDGMPEALANPTLKAIIAETNQSFERVENGCKVNRVQELIAQHGFSEHTYDPFGRRLLTGGTAHNTIYVRDVEHVQDRLASAPRFTLVNGQI